MEHFLKMVISFAINDSPKQEEKAENKDKST